MRHLPIPPHAYNRTILEALASVADEGKLQYQMLSGGWVVLYWHTSKGKDRFIHGYSFDINSQAANNNASDKVATYQLLALCQLAAVPHYLLRPALPQYRRTLRRILQLHPDAVIKPLEGHGGHYLYRVQSPEVADERMTSHPEIAAWAASPFIDASCELRLVVHEGNVALAYRKTRPHTVNGVPLFNLQAGTIPQRLDPASLNPDLVRLAQTGMAAIGLRLGAVDILVDRTGQAQILEINSAFSLEHYAAYDPSFHAEVLALYRQIIAPPLPTAKPVPLKRIPH